MDIDDWLSKDSTHGFIRVYAAVTGSHSHSQLVTCTLSTSTHKICLVLGVSLNALHMQLNGDIIRRCVEAGKMAAKTVPVIVITLCGRL